MQVLVLDTSMRSTIHMSEFVAYDTNREHNVNHGLWVIMMRHCRYINCNKCVSLWGYNSIIYLKKIFGKANLRVATNHSRSQKSVPLIFRMKNYTICIIQTLLITKFSNS